MKLKRMAKKLELLEADKAKRSLVDLKLDGETLGRLVLQNGELYDFNIKSKKEEKCKDELLVDLKIDGLKGPIPKIVDKKKTAKRKVWVDNGDEIDTFETTHQKLKELSDLDLNQNIRKALDYKLSDPSRQTIQKNLENIKKNTRMKI